MFHLWPLGSGSVQPTDSSPPISLLSEPHPSSSGPHPVPSNSIVMAELESPQPAQPQLQSQRLVSNSSTEREHVADKVLSHVLYRFLFPMYCWCAFYGGRRVIIREGRWKESLCALMFSSLLTRHAPSSTSHPAWSLPFDVLGANEYALLRIPTGSKPLPQREPRPARAQNKDGALLKNTKRITPTETGSSFSRSLISSHPSLEKHMRWPLMWPSVFCVIHCLAHPFKEMETFMLN